MDIATRRIDSTDGRIAGWYAGPATDLPTCEWIWRDAGNGPELVQPADWVGPYDDEQAATIAAND